MDSTQMFLLANTKNLASVIQARGTGVLNWKTQIKGRGQFSSIPQARLRKEDTFSRYHVLPARMSENVFMSKFEESHFINQIKLNSSDIQIMKLWN